MIRSIPLLGGFPGLGVPDGLAILVFLYDDAVPATFVIQGGNAGQVKAVKD